VGTSQAASAPTTKDWKKHVPSALRSPFRNPETIADAVISSTVPLLLPSGIITTPLFVASYEIIRFLLDFKSEGLQKAAEKSAIRVSTSYLAPSIAKGLWDNIQPNIESEIANSPYSKLAERAFRKTVTSILRKGSQAMED